MCSCQIFKAEQIMDNAERQLSNAPDSALNTMRSIRKIAIVLPERRARQPLWAHNKFKQFIAQSVRAIDWVALTFTNN